MEDIKPSTFECADQIVTNIPIIVRGLWNRWQGDLPTKITWAQFGLLSLLSRETSTLTELSREWGVSKPSMSKMISILVERGWIERNPPEGDHRRKPLSLTPKGNEIQERTREVVRRNLAKSLAQLTGDQPQQITAALDMLVQILT
ncbi:MAG: MarR family winged helix-turn-helix transcriptional regulator [Chloroflexota bacterium]